MVSGQEKRSAALATLCAAVALLLACATPIGVTHLSARDADRELAQNILNSDRTTTVSREYLERLGLVELYDSNPREALARLRNGLGGPDEVGRLFALSELWFEAALKSGDRGEYLASAVYAWAFLFPKDAARSPTPYDGLIRLALDLYNRGITEGLASPERDEETVLDFSPREIALPFGKLVLTPPEHEFRYGGYRLTKPVALRDVEIRGLRNRYRRAGIGAAVGTKVEAIPGEGSEWIPSNAKVPVTALVRFHDVHASLDRALVNGSLEIYDADETPSVEIEGRPVPLESESSAMLAYRLDKAPVWDFEIAGFRRPDFTLPAASKNGKGLFFLTPYRPGRIPVVFVHGTASSPARWAEMGNELLGDPRIASRFQLWFFIYNSGQPVLVSAANLRESLQAAVTDLDPQGKDPALKQMVVVGHSQGGLLTKLQVVTSGDAFWRNASDVPFESAEMSDETRALLKRVAFFDALPFVTRVVFISTPHKGSYLAENWLGMIARRLVNTPAGLTNAALDLGSKRQTKVLRGSWKIPTAVDNMDWSNPGLRTLYSLPIAPWVHAHSIIPVLEQPFETGKDGVVAYQSAHIAGVESELVVFPCGHSTQGTPTTIEEVRRILYEHAGIH